MAGSLCGVWVDDDGRVHTTVETETGGRETRIAELRPFAWLGAGAGGTDIPAGISVETLGGEGPFKQLAHANEPELFNRFVRDARNGANIDVIRPFESQFLLQ